MQRSIYIHSSKGYIALVLGISLLMLFCSFILVAKSGFNAERIIGITLFSLIGLFGLYKLKNIRRPELVLSAQGIYGRSRAWKNQIIYWDTIRRIEPKTYGRNVRVIELSTDVGKRIISTQSLNIHRDELASLIHRIATLDPDKRQLFIDEVTGPRPF
jgi:hypothetical protein